MPALLKTPIPPLRTPAWLENLSRPALVSSVLLAISLGLSACATQSSLTGRSQAPIETQPAPPKPAAAPPPAAPPAASIPKFGAVKGIIGTERQAGPPSPFEAFSRIFGREAGGGGGSSSSPPFTRIEVEFATNRAKGGTASNISFTGARGDLLFGAAIVTIPFKHREGEVELPPWYEPFAANPAQHFTIENVRVLSGGNWEKEIRDAAQRSGSNAVFIFVHGYNNSFKDALFRTAQIAYDVHFKGAVTMFDWPSVHKLTGYMKDYSNAEWSISDFKLAFRRVVAATHSNEIYVIAHSMGNQVVTRGLVQLAAEDPSVRGRVRELVLAAPDIDAATFRRDIAPFLRRASKHTTLYASSKDYALAASRKLQGYSRAGDTQNGITIVPPIESVDATRASRNFLGHSYVADDSGILHDISELFIEHLPPSKRGLLARRGKGGTYWVYTGN